MSGEHSNSAESTIAAKRKLDTEILCHADNGEPTITEVVTWYRDSAEDFIHEVPSRKHNFRGYGNGEIVI